MEARGVSFEGYGNKILRQYFNVDWEYQIDQKEFTSKREAFESWKRGWKSN